MLSMSLYDIHGGGQTPILNCEQVIVDPDNRDGDFVKPDACVETAPLLL